MPSKSSRHISYQMIGDATRTYIRNVIALGSIDRAIR
jgi:hypothetical protein